MRKDKKFFAEMIESHHLYSPMTDGVYSKNYYRYSTYNEIKLLMKKTKQELSDMYDMLYDCGRELTIKEIN